MRPPQSPPSGTALLLLLASALPASAQLSKDQRACVRGLGRSLPTVNRQVTNQITDCLVGFARGASQGSVEACAAADPKGKIAKSTGKTVESFDLFCTPAPAGKLDDPFPAFGATDAATVNAEGLRAAPDLAHDVFGVDLDGGALSSDAGGARCQQAAWKAVAKCHLSRLLDFGVCTKHALAGTKTTAPVVSQTELRETCLGADAASQPDPRGKIGRKCADPTSGIPGALDKKCDGQDLDALLPGCAGAPDVAQCLQQKAACRACLAISQAHDLDRDCDLFDDGIDNASCTLGPITIACQSPADAAMLVAVPGTPTTFHGQASHPAGIASVTVNGTLVPVAADGTFSLPITTAFGINFVDVVATNALGETGAATCTFLASGTFAAENTLLDNAVMLKLTQAAIDDNSRAGAVNSFDDVLSIVLNSAGLVQALDAGLTAANPLKPSSCDQEVCVLGACVCVLQSGITYVPASARLNGPRTATLTLVNGGLQSVVRFEDPALTLRATGQAAGIPFDTTGTVSIDFVQVNMISDVGVDGAGRPNVSIRAGSVSVSVGSISTSFTGLDGFVLNLATSLANGTVRDIVANTLRNFVTNNFNSVLDGLVSGLDFGDLSASVSIPRIDGSGSITLTFASGLSSISPSPSRVLFGLGARVSGPAAHAIPSLGVALPPGSVFVDPSSPQSIAVSTHVGVLNQALHALWRGGLLHTTVDASLLSGVPAGTSADVEAFLPPVATLRAGNELGLQIGAVRAALTYPGVFDDPVTVEIGAEATVNLALAGDALAIAGITIDAVHLSALDALLDGSELSVLAAVAPTLLERLVDSALGDAALAVRIPGFPIPASLGPYGLPVGSEVRLVNPSLTTSDSRADLRGTLGIQ